MSTVPSASTDSSPPPAAQLETLGVEYPPDHPIARRASQLQAQRERQAAAAQAAASSSGTGQPLGSPTKDESIQAHLLEQFSTPLSVPNSPAEQARRMSITPASRRNSILAIPPIKEDIPAPTDHLPEPGADPTVPLQEIEKEIEEIDTVG